MNRLDAGMTDDDWDSVEYEPEDCHCGRGRYNAAIYSSCYDCFKERRTEFLDCILCGRWHSPNFDICYACRQGSGAAAREEAGRDLRRYILWRDKSECQECGETSDLHVDHIQPCAKGGDASPWNLQVLCRQCNLLKGDHWVPGGRRDGYRRFLIGYYFLSGRGWLTEEQRITLQTEVQELREWSQRRRPNRSATGFIEFDERRDGETP